MYNANRCGGMCPRPFCINREKVAGLPFKPYGILVHSQNPVGDRNAVLVDLPCPVGPANNLGPSQ